jgi:hypothetical protein
MPGSVPSGTLCICICICILRCACNSWWWGLAGRKIWARKLWFLDKARLKYIICVDYGRINMWIKNRTRKYEYLIGRGCQIWISFGEGNVNNNLLSDGEFGDNRCSEETILYVNKILLWHFTLFCDLSEIRHWSSSRSTVQFLLVLWRRMQGNPYFPYDRTWNDVSRLPWRYDILRCKYRTRLQSQCSGLSHGVVCLHFCFVLGLRVFVISIVVINSRLCFRTYHDNLKTQQTN